jgi:hypothetical protein
MGMTRIMAAKIAWHLPSCQEFRVRPVFIIEETSLQGTSTSAKRGRCRSATNYTTFSSEGQLEAALQNFGIWLTEQEEGNLEPLLVISAHGYRGTGTWISLVTPFGDDWSESKTINPKNLSKYFEALPAFTAYLSVCWGGYPGFVTAVRGVGESRTTVVGPLVPIYGKDATRLQDLVFEADVDHLPTRLADFNAKFEKGYFQAPSRLVTRKDEWSPPKGTAGLAAVRTREKMSVVALQVLNGGRAVVLWNGNHLIGTSRDAFVFLSQIDDDDATILGRDVEVTFKASVEPDRLPMGLAHLLKVRPLGKASSLVPPIVRTHSHETDLVGDSERAAYIPLGTLKGPCSTCNWVAITFQGLSRDPTFTAACRRTACEEHPNGK